MKQLNERKLIRQDLDRIAKSMREELPAKNKVELDAAFADLKSIAQNTPGETLTDWDRESLRIATEYVRDESKDEFRRAINRILELAGLSPEMEKHIYQRQQIEKNKSEPGPMCARAGIQAVAFLSCGSWEALALSKYPYRMW